MGDFSAAWLTLREPFDHAARDPGLSARLAGWLSERAGPLHVVDLACGRGSNLRYLAPRLPHPQRWTLLDLDDALLDSLQASALPEGVPITPLRCDLRAGLSVIPEDADLVVTSALLDLVSADWLAALADHLLAQHLPLLAVLSVDGRVRWHPEDPRDSDVMRWFRAHQHTDRGFGPSPGVAAVDVLAGLLEAGGMAVHTAAADWEIGPEHPEMLAEMVRGIAHASAEMSPRPAAVARWQADRLAALSSLRLTVGHRDLLALPTATPGA